MVNTDRDKPMNKITRRKFLKNSTLATAGVALGTSILSAKSYMNIMGANDRINFAVVGLRNRGKAHIKAIENSSDAQLTHLCDVDQVILDKITRRVKKSSGTTPETIKDFRKMLESKDIDAVTIATPEHWHAHMAVMSMEAGKHVYIEKPISHNPAEGEILINAQKNYGKIAQMGNQQRSSIHTIEAINKIHDGILGKTYMGNAWYANSRGPIGIGNVVPVPETLDWDLWQGPAPRRQYKDNIHPYNWHWFWHWGTGETLNNGTHEVDLCRWALQVGYPEKISAEGGRYHYSDDWEFYDTLVTNFDYGNKLITWEGNSCNGKLRQNRGRGVTIHGTEGTMLIDREGYEIFDLKNEKTFVYTKPEEEKQGKKEKSQIIMTFAHFQNFINAINSGEKLRSPLDEGNVSITILQLSNIAWKVGRTLNLDPQNGHILNDKKAEKFWSREYEPGWELK